MWTTTTTILLFSRLVLLFLVILAVITVFLLLRVKEQFQQKDPMLIEIRNQLSRLSPQAKYLEFYEDDKSYTINKRRIYLCLRDENRAYYSMNMLMYVAIHELAHVICDEIGHTPKFHKIFSELLEKAGVMGIYDAGEPLVPDYCTYDPKNKNTQRE